MASGALGMGVVGLLAAGVNSLADAGHVLRACPSATGPRATRWLALGTVAVVSRFPPAWRACQMTPVEALREER